MPIVRGRPGTTSVRVQLPQLTPRDNSSRLSKMLVTNASMFHFGQSSPAKKSTTVEERILPCHRFGSQVANPPTGGSTNVQSKPTPESGVRLRRDERAEPL